MGTHLPYTANKREAEVLYHALATVPPGPEGLPTAVEHEATLMDLG